MNEKVKDIMYSALLAAIVAILAQIKIDITGYVPITMQTLGIYLVGLILTPKYAFLSAFVYVALGLIGLPVYAGWQGGIGSLLGPAGGYIYSFPVVAWSISVVVMKRDTIVFQTLALLVGTLICYTIGTAWFMYVTEYHLIASLGMCVFPFLIGDSMKIIVAILLSSKIKEKIRK